MFLSVEVGKWFAERFSLLGIALLRVMLHRSEQKVVSVRVLLGTDRECKRGWTWSCSTLCEKLPQQLNCVTKGQQTHLEANLECISKK